jgi:mycofactocin system glycosyltransferase
VQCDPETAVLSRGRVLLGGSPLRLLTLSAAGSAVWEALLAGAAVGAAGPGAGTLARRLVDAGLAHPAPPAPPPGRAGDVTAVLPVRDHAAGLASLVTALGRRCAEVIVVDDGSTDATGAVAAAAGARVLRHEAALGPAAARLAGAGAATTPLVLFCDADILLPESQADWLGRMLGHLADPAVGAVAPRVASPVPVGTRPGLLHRYEAARSPLDLGRRPAAVRPGSRVGYVPSAVLLIRRELVAFDPALRYGEDVDLVWRLVEVGWAVRYEPAAVVHHRPRADWPGWARQRFGYGSSAGPLAVRHPAPLRPARAAAAATLGALAVAAAPRGVARAAAAGAVTLLTAGRGAYSVARLSERLAAAPRPRRLAVVMLLAGRRFALESAADNVRRGWWPLLAASRPGRRVVAAAVVLPAVRDWWVTRPDVGLVPYVLLRLFDDAAYSAGVWSGSVQAWTARPLLPARPGWARGPRSWSGHRAAERR